MWGGGGQGNGPQAAGLSVVTTVWGVTQTTNTGPTYNQNPNVPAYTNTTMSSTPHTQQPGYTGNHGPMPNKPYGPGGPQGMPGYGVRGPTPGYNNTRK